jgi:hypothetical protein
LGNITQRTFDANGNLTTEVKSRLVDGRLELLTRSYQYDQLNRLIRSTDAEGGVIETILLGGSRPTPMTRKISSSKRRIQTARAKHSSMTPMDG